MFLTKSRITAASLMVAATVLCIPLAQATTDTVPLKPCCTDDSTYQAFGQREGINKLMKAFVQDLMADDRTRPFFQSVDHQRLVAMLTEQVCQATGGPCEYRGRSMTDAHRGMGVKREHFNALVEVLQRTMDRANVPFRDQNKLLAVFAPMYRDIEQPAGG